jgi:hypothetical protein
MNPAWWNGGRQTAGTETDPSRLQGAETADMPADQPITREHGAD